MERITKNGFTLVELLGVVTILGIIMLIAIPKVKTTIDDAKKKSFEDTAYGIIRAGNLYYSRKEMNGETLEEEMFTFPDNAEELKIQGKLPKSGTIIISETGDISIAISNKDYCITKGYNDKEITITEDVENCKNSALPNTLTDLVTTSTEVTSIPECITNNTTCTAGTQVAIKVNETETYNFYVISETDNKVTLIMDRNLGDNVMWISGDDYTTANTDGTSCSYTSCNDEGPVTAVAALKERTSGWTNIPEQEYTYSDDGGGNKYTAFTETMRARMLTYTEATTTLGCTGSGKSCPSWLYINLKNTGSDTDSAGNPRYGYWTSAADTGNSNYVRSIDFNGNVLHSNTISRSSGVRPVIELSKSL